MAFSTIRIDGDKKTDLIVSWDTKDVKGPKDRAKGAFTNYVYKVRSRLVVQKRPLFVNVYNIENIKAGG